MEPFGSTPPHPNSLSRLSGQTRNVRRWLRRVEDFRRDPLALPLTHNSHRMAEGYKRVIRQAGCSAEDLHMSPQFGSMPRWGCLLKPSYLSTQMQRKTLQRVPWCKKNKRQTFLPSTCYHLPKWICVQDPTIFCKIRTPKCPYCWISGLICVYASRRCHASGE